MRTSALSLVLAVGLCLSAARATAAQQPDATPPSSSPAPTDQSPPPAGSTAAAPTPEELQRQLQVLAEEIEKLRSGEPDEREMSTDERQALGLGPSAAAIYRKKQGVSFAGYGEALFDSAPGHSEEGEEGGNAGLGSSGAQVDFLRAVLYTGYRFSSRIVFNSEVEFEHGGNEVSVEFAYLDFAINRHASLRAGMLLLPMGLVNEFHEPTVYLGARRPETEQRLLPSTWHEDGVGLLGSAGRFSYRAFVVNGFDAAGFGATGLRDGRQGGAEASATDFAFAGRADYAIAPGVFAGGSLYAGGADQGGIEVDGRKVGVTTTIVEGHAQAQVRGVDLRALVATAGVGNAAGLNRARGLAGEDAVASRMTGGYLQAGYNLLSQRSTTIALTPYYRLEHLDTQARMPDGFESDPETRAWYHTAGIEFRPIYAVVVKADHQWVHNAEGTGKNRFNLSLGYAF